MGTSVKASDIEKLQEDIRIACSNLEKLGYDSLVIVASTDNHAEMGSGRGRRFLERKLSLIGEFFQYCKEASLYGNGDAQTDKLYVAEPLKSNGANNKVLKPKVLKILANKKQSHAAPTSFRQKPPIVVIRPKQPDGGEAVTDPNTSDEDSDHSEMDTPELNTCTENLTSNTKRQEPVKGTVLPKNDIVIITKDEMEKKSSEIVKANQNLPVMAKKTISPELENPNRTRKAPVTQIDIGQFPVKTYDCDQCDKKYRRNEDLIIHKRKHSGELPYSCRTCGKKFISRNCLRAHLNVHFDDTPYRCTHCGQLFARQPYLNRHVKAVHSDEYSYVCEICGHGFKNPTGLYNHKVTHSSEKNFACETCGKRFLRLPALNSHKLIHTGEKPYACTICWAEFRMKKNLATHQRRKHPII